MRPLVTALLLTVFAAAIFGPTPRSYGQPTTASTAADSNAALIEFFFGPGAAKLDTAARCDRIEQFIADQKFESAAAAAWLIRTDIREHAPARGERIDAALHRKFRGHSASYVFLDTPPMRATRSALKAGIRPGTDAYEQHVAEQWRIFRLEQIRSEHAHALHRLLERVAKLEQSDHAETAAAARATRGSLRSAVTELSLVVPIRGQPARMAPENLGEFAQLARRLAQPHKVHPDLFGLKEDEYARGQEYFSALLRRYWTERDDWFRQLRAAAVAEAEKRKGDQPRHHALLFAYRPATSTCEGYLMSRHALGGSSALREAWEEVTGVLRKHFGEHEAFYFRCLLARALLLSNDPQVEQIGADLARTLPAELLQLRDSGERALDEAIFTSARLLIGAAIATGNSAAAGPSTIILSRRFPELFAQQKDAINAWREVGEGRRPAASAMDAYLAHAIVRNTPSSAKLATFIELSPHLYRVPSNALTQRALPEELIQGADDLAKAIFKHVADLPPEEKRQTVPNWQRQYESVLAEADLKRLLITAVAFSALADHASRDELRGVAPLLIGWAEKLLDAARLDRLPQTKDFIVLTDHRDANWFDLQLRWRLAITRARVDEETTFASLRAKRLELDRRQAVSELEWHASLGAPIQEMEAVHQRRLSRLKTFLTQNEVLHPDEFEADFIRSRIDALGGHSQAMNYIDEHTVPSRQVALYRQFGAEIANRANPGWPRYQ